jgi:PAS domain S-box-containing protein
MNAIFDWLLDRSGPRPRAECGDWPSELVWLHVGSDLFLGLAYLSIPLVLLYFGRRRRDVRVPPVAWLLALALVADAAGHLAEVVGFYRPVHRPVAVIKTLAAVAGWAAVLFLVPAVPQLLDASAAVARTRTAQAPRTPSRLRDYIIAVLAAVLAVLVRRLLDPVLEDSHPYVISLLAVIFVAWEGGFGPAMLTLFISTGAVTYWFVPPRGQWFVTGLPNQVGFGLFIFGGVMCGLLGEAQRHARARAERARDEEAERRFELEAEVARRKQTEDALKESEGRFRSLADSAPVLIWLSELDRQRSYFNRFWLTFTGQPLAEQLGDGWAGSIHPDDRSRYLDLHAASFDSREPFEIEYRLRRYDGQYRWVLARGTPRFGPGGAFAGFVGLCIDIDDRKRMEENLERMVAERTDELEKANAALRLTGRELERSNRELEKFAYVASHDLQEPLRKIQSFGDRLRVRYREAVAGQGAEYVDRMLASAGRMRRLIDDLLTFSRVTTQARPFEPLDLNATLADVAEDLADRVEQTGATLDVGPLPQLEADPSQIRQLFQNLLGNALKFHRLGVPPVIRVRAEPVPGESGEDGAYRLTVTDNGIGFDEKYLDRIFQVFQRLHGRDEYEGTGVGLAICQKIVERHGGTITATSRPGGGATFVVTLPARPPGPASPMG